MIENQIYIYVSQTKSSTASVKMIRQIVGNPLNNLIECVPMYGSSGHVSRIMDFTQHMHGACDDIANFLWHIYNDQNNKWNNRNIKSDHQ